MPRRRSANPLRRRLDRRRPEGNGTGAQRRPPRGRPGQVETIAERRAVALELRKAGGSYRESHSSSTWTCTRSTATSRPNSRPFARRPWDMPRSFRALELERCDQMVAGLWPLIQSGTRPPRWRARASPNAGQGCSASMRLSSRRARSANRSRSARRRASTHKGRSCSGWPRRVEGAGGGFGQTDG